ncbi:MAG: hypothetical protein QM528_01855 [Phycisphaerales bacterium]|nr:hypothetical protein [Phycisphaerales bacterium]
MGRYILTLFSFAIFSCSYGQMGTTNGIIRIKSFENYKKTHAYTIPVRFTNIGPSVMSGRVVDIAVNPKKTIEFYVAYATGGVWHTTDNGISFKPVFDSASTTCIGSIAVNWQTGVIWVGTGEPNSSRSSYAGVGVFKSTDMGKTWVNMGLAESHHISKIIVDPFNDQIVYVAVVGHLFSTNKERGVYKTTNGGNTWQKILYVDDTTGCIDLQMDEKNPHILYAAMWHRLRGASFFSASGNTSALYKTTDAGNKWLCITLQGSGFPNGSGVGRIGIALVQSNPNIIYAVVDNHNEPSTSKDSNTNKKLDSAYKPLLFKNLSINDFEALDNSKLDSFLVHYNFPKNITAAYLKTNIANHTYRTIDIWNFVNDAEFALLSKPNIIGGQLYKSIDGGKTWVCMATLPSSFYSTYGYYFGGVFVSPKDPDLLILTGYRLLLSTNGGKTLNYINQYNTHVDFHCAWIDPEDKDHFVAGNDGGCVLTYDAGTHWFFANTPPVGQYYAVAVDDAKPYNIYGGLQDNGVWVGHGDTQPDSVFDFNTEVNSFRNVLGGDGMQVQVDKRDNTSFVAGYQFGNYYRLNRDSILFSQLNGYAIHDNTPIIPTKQFGQPLDRLNWQTPILLSSFNPDILYYGSNYFYRSFQKHHPLERASEQDLTTNPNQGDVPYGTLTTIAESPLQFGLIYVGSDDGLVHVSTDDGLTWQLISSSLPQGYYVSRVVASQYKNNRVYVTLNGYRNDNFTPLAYVSNDYGHTWTRIFDDLPLTAINVIREDPKKEAILYVGTDAGLFVSFNNGRISTQWSEGLPNGVPIHDIAIQPTHNDIILGTHGRSLYRARLDIIQMYDGGNKKVH